jgi:hypothetical protein
VTFGAQARIRQNLRNGIAGRCALLELVRTAHGRDEVGRVVVGNVLQSVGDARDEIIFSD